MMALTSTFHHPELDSGYHMSFLQDCNSANIGHRDIMASSTAPSDPVMRKQQSGAGLRRITLTPERMSRKPMFSKSGRLPVRPTSSPTQPPETTTPETPNWSPTAQIHDISASSETSGNSSPYGLTMKAHPVRTDGSMYCGPHFDACTFDSLDHKLACGHKMLTEQPEPCANNCHVREPPDYAQPRDLDQAFVCIACIGNHIQARQTERYTAFKTELETLAVENGKAADWVEQKLGLMAMAWQDEDVEEIKMLSSKRRGKPSQPLWIGPELKGLVEIALKENRLGRRSSRSTLFESRPTSPTPSTASNATATTRRESKLPPLQGSLRGLRNWHSRQSSASSITTDTQRESMKEGRPSIDTRKDSRTSGIPLWMEPQLPESPARAVEISPRREILNMIQIEPWYEKATLHPYERKWLSHNMGHYD